MTSGETLLITLLTRIYISLIIKVSSEWMEIDEAGVHRAAQATVLFVSPSPQLDRNYEPVSDWV